MLFGNSLYLFRAQGTNILRFARAYRYALSAFFCYDFMGTSYVYYMSEEVCYSDKVGGYLTMSVLFGKGPYPGSPRVYRREVGQSSLFPKHACIFDLSLLLPQPFFPNMLSNMSDPSSSPSAALENDDDCNCGSRRIHPWFLDARDHRAAPP